MHDSVNQLGTWWVPGSPDERATGVLDLDAAEDPHVTLVERLTGVRPTRSRCPTLLGETLEGVPLTLLHPIVLQQITDGGSGRITTRLRGPILLRGVHAESEDAFRFARARVRFGGLREICLLAWPDGQGRIAPFVGPGQARRVEVKGGSLTFEHSVAESRTKFGSTREEEVHAVIEADAPVSLAQFEERWLRPLQSLLILATREPSSLQSATAVIDDADFAESVHPAIRHGTSPRIWNEREVVVVAASPGLVADPSHDYDRPLVPFAALGDGIQDFIGRWWDLHTDLGYAAVYLMSAWGSRMYLENKLLNEMSFSESYHRIKHNKRAISKADDNKKVKRMLALIEDADQRTHYRQKLAHSYEPNSRDRLEWLIERADRTLHDVQALDGALADRLIQARNSLVHLDPTAETEHAELFLDIRRLELVIQTNLLLDLQLEPDLVEGLVKTSYRMEVPLIEFVETEEG